MATAPVNLHLSFDRLAGIVREQLGADPRSDTLIVFHNRARTHVKLLWHDGSGYCLFYKRLDRGTYRISLAIPPGAQQVAVSARELALVLEGIDEATPPHRVVGAFSRISRPCRGRFQMRAAEQVLLAHLGLPTEAPPIARARSSGFDIT